MLAQERICKGSDVLGCGWMLLHVATWRWCHGHAPHTSDRAHAHPHTSERAHAHPHTSDRANVCPARQEPSPYHGAWAHDRGVRSTDVRFCRAGYTLEPCHTPHAPKCPIGRGRRCGALSSIDGGCVSEAVRAGCGPAASARLLTHERCAAFCLCTLNSQVPRDQSDEAGHHASAQVEGPKGSALDLAAVDALVGACAWSRSMATKASRSLMVMSPMTSPCRAELAGERADDVTGAQLVLAAAADGEGAHLGRARGARPIELGRLTSCRAEASSS